MPHDTTENPLATERRRCLRDARELFLSLRSLGGLPGDVSRELTADIGACDKALAQAPELDGARRVAPRVCKAFRADVRVHVVRPEPGARGYAELRTTRDAMIDLTPLETDVMVTLAMKLIGDGSEGLIENAGWCELEDLWRRSEIWPTTFSDTAVRNQISRIRKKLVAIGFPRDLIETRRGGFVRLSTHPENVSLSV